MIQELATLDSVVVKQRKELLEIVGFETRNKYDILTQDGRQIGFAAEQQKGFFGMFMRQLVGHWRSFDVNIFDMQRQLQYKASHPFRFYFQRIEVSDPQGQRIGTMERQFSILSKKFRMFDKNGMVSSEMYSGLFRIWTFPIKRNGVEVAKISKKWGGAMTEIFLDADTFLLEFYERSLTLEERATLLCAAVFVDLLYFENNQGGSGFNIGNVLSE